MMAVGARNNGKETDMDGFPNDQDPHMANDNSGDGGVSDPIQQQIDAIRDEISRIAKQVSEGAATAKDAASGWYENASAEAREVSQVAKAYPVAVSSTFIAGTLLGLIVGLMLSTGDHHRRWR